MYRCWGACLLSLLRQARGEEGEEQSPAVTVVTTSGVSDPLPFGGVSFQSRLVVCGGRKLCPRLHQTPAAQSVGMKPLVPLLPPAPVVSIAAGDAHEMTWCCMLELCINSPGVGRSF
jgi:hypothetical protein